MLVQFLTESNSHWLCKTEMIEYFVIFFMLLYFDLVLVFFKDCLKSIHLKSYNIDIEFFCLVLIEVPFLTYP